MESPKMAKHPNRLYSATILMLKMHQEEADAVEVIE
jgi:hypothetical protein